MHFRRLGLACALLALPLHAGEVRAGIGFFFVVPDGVDALVSFRPTGSPWSFGLRHVQWTDVAHDPWTGRSLSDTLETRTGALAAYHFRPEARGSFYLAGGLYRWTKREHSRINGDSSRDTALAPALGGGYTRLLGRHFFWNFGMLLGPSVNLHTQTSTGSEKDSGSFDILLQVGLRLR